MNHSTIVQSLASGIRLSIAVVLLALLAGLLAVAQPVRAGTYEVTITATDGAGSLREAIRDAEAHPGADTITFAATTDRIPIVLSGPAGENDNVGGDLDIYDNGDLTIQGNGEGNTIIDGNGNDRVFHVCPGGGCTNTVTFSGMTIQNGKVTLSGGGGIRNQGGTTIVDSSTIRGNTAVNGGGIANFATLTIQNGSTIGGEGVGNQVVDGNGGGIYNFAGTLTVDRSTVSANTAGKNGGGIWSQVTLNIQNGSTIGGPEAGNLAEYGGGIFNKAGITTVDGSAVSGNTATISDGGGIYNKATLIIQSGSTIGGAGAANTAASDGGGIYNYEGTTTVDGSTVSANTAGTNGGGIWNQATLNVQNGSIIGGSDEGNTANDAGGGIFNRGTTTVDGSTVSGNTATNYDGGGIHNSETLIIQNGSTIGGAGASNTAGGRGGGILNSGTTTMDGSTVNANMAENGGGIYNQATLTVQNGSTIGRAGAGNLANSKGGGIYNITGTTTLIASTASANKANSKGGGIYNIGSLNVLNDSTIGGAGAGNTANKGGGIFNFIGRTTLNGSTVSDNTAGDDGGGIFNDIGRTILNGSIVSDNTAGHDGGGIFNDIGTTTMNGSAVSANTSKNGGGIYNQGTLDVTNSTIGGGGANHATIWGGGIFNYDGDTTVTGSCILNNRATINGGGLFNNGDSFRAVNVTGSSIAGNSDTSFFNNQQTTELNAAGNWWGAATGPNTPGADTVDGKVVTSSFLDEPIPGCVPDLQVGKVNDSGGTGKVGEPFHWILTISNSGESGAIFAAGQTILIDDLPARSTYGVPAAGTLVDITNGDKIQCSLADDTITCKAAGGDVILAAKTGSFEVTISVTPDAPATLTNPKAGGTCKVDPGGEVTENDDSNNDCPENTVDVSISFSYLYLPVVMK